MLLNDLLCVRSQHTKRTFQSPVLTLSTSMRAEQRIYNSTVELLDLQAQAVIPWRCKEAILEPFKGCDGDILHNTLGCPSAERAISYKAFTESVFFFFFFFSASVFLPSGHLSLIPVAAVIRYVNDLSLSQTQQINQGQWVPFRCRTGEGGGGGVGGWG